MNENARKNRLRRKRQKRRHETRKYFGVKKSKGRGKPRSS
jgi:hypothetical protein